METFKLTFNKTALFLILAVFVTNGTSGPLKSASSDYFRNREQITKDEDAMAIGGDLVLKGDEIKANDIVMSAKHKEIDQAFNSPKLFLPARNFIQARSEIVKSKVFQIIQQMPKGAVLHVHDKAMASAEFLFNNITYQPNLFICEEKGQYSFRFFSQPDKTCRWQNLQELRKLTKKRDELNDKLYHELNMLTKFPNDLYTDLDATWAKFQTIFIRIGPLLTYRPVFETYIYQGLQELYDDNIMYAELRTSLTPLYELDGTIHSTMEVANIYQEVINRFMKAHPDFVGVKLIYSRWRKMNLQELRENIEVTKRLKKAHPNLVIGFDLVGQEDKGDPLINFADELKAIGNDLQFFFHAGESKWYGMDTDENLIDAVLLNTKRIGHGYALLKHPKVMEQVQKKKIAIEVSPISNQVLKLVEDLRNHPASAFFAENLPIVISNDDPSLWGAKGLSYDFYEAFVGMMSYHSDLRSLKTLAMNSLTYSGMDNNEKAKAYEIFNRKWDAFVQSVIRSF